jgi:hypothetical protein
MGLKEKVCLAGYRQKIDIGGQYNDIKKAIIL